MRSTVLCIGLLLCSWYGVGQQNLDEVVVTANKFSQKQSLTAKVLTVLSDSVLAQYQGYSVAELLNRQAGIVVSGANSVAGSNQELYMRGAANGNTLILIDGVPMYDPSYISSGFDLNLLAVCECERIEILKGSQSSLYGSNAVAGVVQIFTKKQKKESESLLNMTSMAGNLGQLKNIVGINLASKKGYINVQHSYNQQKGLSAAEDKNDVGFENDAFKQNALQLNGGFYLNEKVEWRLQGLYSNYKANLDAGPYVDEKDYTSTQKFASIGSSLVGQMNKGSWRVGYNFAQNNRKFTNDSSYVAPKAFDQYSYSSFVAQAHFVDAYLNKKVSDHWELSLGTDFRASNLEQAYYSISSFGKYEAPTIGTDSTSSHMLSVYGSGVYHKNKLVLELGARLNQHSLYGLNSTYSIAPAWLLKKNWKMFASLATGFRAPSPYQLFSEYGNKDLKPESSQSLEIGQDLSHNNLKLRTVFFSRKLQHLVFFESLNTAPYGRYINFDKQADHGFEIESALKIKNTNVWASYSYVNGKLSTKIAGADTSFNNLFRRPKHQVLWGVQQQLNSKILLSLLGQHTGLRVDRFFNETTYKTENVDLTAYFMLNFYGSYQVAKLVKIFVDAKNITNARYQDAYGYSTKPINVLLGLRLGR